jgi:hypothetical protein
MGQSWDIKRMAELILAIKKAAVELRRTSGGIQAVDRNVEQILASVKLLELNISDLVDL